MDRGDTACPRRVAGRRTPSLPGRRSRPQGCERCSEAATQASLVPLIVPSSSPESKTTPTARTSGWHRRLPRRGLPPRRLLRARRKRVRSTLESTNGIHTEVPDEGAALPQALRLGASSEPASGGSYQGGLRLPSSVRAHAIPTDWKPGWVSTRWTSTGCRRISLPGLSTRKIAPSYNFSSEKCFASVSLLGEG